MIWILVTAIVLIAIAFGAFKLSRKAGSGDVDYPYQCAGPLFTPSERSFYGALGQAVGANATIFGKVRVADVAIPRKGLSKSEWQRAFNKISGKHFDFLLCRKDDLSVICAIELDDSSHKAEKRQRRDAFLSGVCDAAHIPLIQVPAKVGYVIGEIKELLAPYMDLDKPLDQGERISLRQHDDDQRICPKCSSSMVVRVAKNGSNAGRKFWACTSFPKCRHVEAINA